MATQADHDSPDLEPWVPRQTLYGPAWFAVLLPSLPPVLLWLVTPAMISGFSSPPGALRSLGLLAGLCAFTSFATDLLIGARVPWIERLFRSLDRMYRFHRRLGVAVGGLLAAHVALMLGSLAAAQVTIVDVLTESGIAWGVVALAGFAAIVAVSLFARLRHEVFQRIHRLIGLVFAAASVHVLMVPGVAAHSPALRNYVIAATAVGVGAWLYRSLLGSRLVRRHAYRVADVVPVRGDIHELVLDPVEDPLRFEPGQFVFIAIDDEAVTREAHPFSITSRSGETQLRLMIKAVGDFTTALGDVSPGARVVVEGPFGGFWHLGADLAEQVWVAGGIGITPFLAMARSGELPEGAIDLYYCVMDRGAAVALEELEEIAAGHEGMRVIPVPFDTEGHLTAERIAATSGDLSRRHVFMCGPQPMIDALVPDLTRAGVAPERLHYEEFRLRGR